MKNFGFCAISAVLMTVIFVSGLTILRSGEGIALMTSVRSAASRNSKKISDSTLETYSKEKIPLPNEPTELTADMLDSIIIDGMEYAFPIRMGELSEEFSYSVTGCSADEETGAGYVGTLTLNYKVVSIASAFFESSTPGVDDDTVIFALNFFGDTNDYIPQMIVGGIDVHNADIREINRVYGYDSEEYGYRSFPAENDKGVYTLKLSKSGGIFQLRYLDKDSDIIEDIYDRNIMNYTETAALPDNYSFEEDTVNSEMEYIPLPEKNEEFLEIMKSIEIGGEPLRLPCTLNALMSRCGEDAYFDYFNDNFNYWSEYGAYTITGYIKFGGMQLFVKILVTPGRPIGDSQVIELSSSSAKDFIDGLDIEGKNSFGFSVNELDDERYDLTHMQYNNVSVKKKEFTISYWGENMEER